MKTKVAFVLVVLFILTACGSATEMQTPIANDPVMPITGAFVVNDHADARDFVVRHIVAFYSLEEPIEWVVQGEYPDSSGDGTTIIFTNLDWWVQVDAADLGLECIVYYVNADYSGKPGFHWEGSVDACGRIREDVADYK